MQKDRHTKATSGITWIARFPCSDTSATGAMVKVGVIWTLGRVAGVDEGPTKAAAKKFGGLLIVAPTPKTPSAMTSPVI